MIKSRAPVRIDLAGGTLDIFPLYLFHEEGLTVNAAVNLYTEADIELRDDKEIHIISRDLGIEVKFPSINDIGHDNSLSLFSRAVGFFRPKQGINLYVKSPVPKGSGLGTSSAMLIAAVGALNILMKTGYDKKQLVEIAQGIETTVLQIPTGRQDYLAAAHGGFNALHFRTAWDDIERIDVSKDFAKALREEIILCYTGESHYSGLTNWDMFKMRVDGNETSINALEQIKKTAFKMEDALKNEDLGEVGRVVLEEWSNRTKLSKGVCTKQMSVLIEKAKENGAYSYKACGAGGGGCMIFMAAKKDRGEVEKALKSSGAMILDYDFDFGGLEVNEN